MKKEFIKGLDVTNLILINILGVMQIVNGNIWVGLVLILQANKVFSQTLQIEQLKDKEDTCEKRNN